MLDCTYKPVTRLKQALVTRCGLSDNAKYKEDVMLYTRLRLLEKLANIEQGACRTSQKSHLELLF